MNDKSISGGSNDCTQHMRNHISNIIRCLAIVGVLSLVACKRQPEPVATPEKPTTTSAAPKGSFEAVTSHLDPGGDLYMYVGTERFLKGTTAKIASLRQLLGDIPEMKSANRENLERVVGVATNLFLRSGIEDVRGLGISSILREDGLYHSKAMLHHASGAGSGFLWNLFGRQVHTLGGLDLLPANTAMAVFSDLDASLLWSEIKKQVAQSGWPQADEMLQKLPEEFEKATGAEWEKVIDSLGGEFGFAITLDEAKSVSVPIPGDKRIEFPEPALMLVLKVKDDTVFNQIDAALKKSGQQIFQTDKPNFKMRTLTLPVPLPVPLGLNVAASEGYLFIASTDALVQQALAVKAGQKPGLKSTEEFKRLSKDLPQQGNHFTFVSQRLSQTVNRIQRQAMQMAPAEGAGPAKLIQAFMSGGEPGFYYSVGGNSAEGWIWAANGNQPPTKFLVAAAVVPAGVFAGLAVPAVAHARRGASHPAPSAESSAPENR